MRTTLKRGVGRGAGARSNGRAVFPPGTISAVSRYRQPSPPPSSPLRLLRRILLGTLLILISLATGAAGGAYLWFHQSLATAQAHTPAVVRAAKSLDIPVADHAAIALAIGYDHRAGLESAGPSRSDTIMLIRADPVTKTISLLSFPRDLVVPIYCGKTPYTHDRINAAYALCGPKGTLLTVKHLTGLPVNYLITVNFHGFKEVVNKLGGVWLDIDRRYYNPAGRGYATIHLDPGYQRLTGGAALDFVRFRHTDSDFVRLARQQEFVRAFKEQVSKSFSFFKLPGLVNSIVANIEVAAGGHKLRGSEVYSYAFFAKDLPGGHFFQDRIQNVSGTNELTASPQDIQNAVNEFVNPDVQSSREANAAALGRKLKHKAPPPSTVTVTVLNGNGVAGAAANASYLLGQRGYKAIPPPSNLEPNAPTTNYFHSKIYYDPSQRRSKAAAVALQQLMQPADVARLPRTPGLVSLDPGSMLMVVLGQPFHGDIAPVPVHVVPKHQPAYVRYDAGAGTALLQQVARKVPFTLEAPTVLELSSYPDTLSGD